MSILGHVPPHDSSSSSFKSNCASIREEEQVLEVAATVEKRNVVLRPVFDGGTEYRAKGGRGHVYIADAQLSLYNFVMYCIDRSY